MINTKYLKHVSEEKQDAIYKSMIRDIYYFYYGVRPNEKENITCLNGLIYDMSKGNLKLVANS